MSDVTYKDVQHAMKTWHKEQLSINEVADLVNSTLHRSYKPSELKGALDALSKVGEIKIIENGERRYSWNRG